MSEPPASAGGSGGSELGFQRLMMVAVQTFQADFLNLLKKHRIEYDSRYALLNGCIEYKL
jgi:hypothetical protein